MADDAQVTAAEARRQRLEAALRTNLRRRKAQARALDRQESEAGARERDSKDEAR